MHISDLSQEIQELIFQELQNKGIDVSDGFMSTETIASTPLYESHKNLPHMQQIINCEQLPIIIDSSYDPINYPGGLVLDGYKRLLWAVKNGQEDIVVIDVSKIQPLKEDQYKTPTRKQIRKQSMFPSSFAPSTSYGGISKYKKRKKTTFTENIARKLEQLE